MRFLAMTMLAGALAAQGPRGPRPMGPPPMDELKSYLGLSDTQADQLRQANRSFRESTRPLMREMAEKRRAMRDQVDAGSAEAAGRLAIEMDALHKQLRSKHEAAQAEATALLTADQKAKLAALEEAAGKETLTRQARAANLLAAPEGMRPGGPRPGMGGRRGRFGGPAAR